MFRVTFIYQQLWHNFVSYQLLTTTPTRFGVCIRHLQRFLDVFRSTSNVIFMCYKNRQELPEHVVYKRPKASEL